MVSVDVFANATPQFRRMLAQDGECVIWTGALYEKGYGAYKHKGRTLSAHRVAYAWHYGAIPGDAILMHRCDRPGCVNPLHLTPGTRAENNRDMHKKCRHTHGDRHHHAKLTGEKVTRMRQRYAAGETLETLAREYGVSAPTIHYAIKRRTWKHVP